MMPELLTKRSSEGSRSCSTLLQTVIECEQVREVDFENGLINETIHFNHCPSSSRIFFNARSSLQF